MKKLYKDIFLSNKKITLATILLFILVIVVAIIVSFSSKSSSFATTSTKYGSYKKKGKATLNENNIKYKIDYLDYFDTTNHYALDVDENGNYKLVYTKYESNNSKNCEKYYFNGTLLEKDLSSFKEIVERMNMYLEGIKVDDNYSFYYSYKDVSEQNENGNRFLKAIMEEFINYTMYDSKTRISNFEEIFSVMIKFSENPELDLDAELVFNEKGRITESTPVVDVAENVVQEVDNTEPKKEQTEQSTSNSNIPLATGKKSNVARLDRIIIDFKDDATEEDAFRVIGKIDSGILFRFEEGNRYIITIEQCENENKVQEVCNKIKSENDIVENAEICYE